MHTVVQGVPIVSMAHDAVSRPIADAGAAARVAVAGATGYAGQELLRLLARHPAVTVTAAMSSTSPGATSAARRLPALSRVWDGAVSIELRVGGQRQELDEVA